MVDFRARQRTNRRRSAIVLAAFAAGYAAFGAALDSTWGGIVPLGPLPVPLMTAAALLVAGATNLAAYYAGARLVLTSLGAEPLRPADPEHRQLQNIVTEMALAAGLPAPAVYVLPDPAPNALATGRDPAHAAIAVTRGLLYLLDRAETQGVVAHEMAHIGNRDTLTMTLVSVLLGGTLLLADWTRRGVYYRRDRSVHPVRGVVVLVILAFAPLLARLLAMAVSRQREYLADATAVALTRNPLALARALEKIGAATWPARAAARGTQHLFITAPRPRRADEREGFLAGLLATHPPLAHRIHLLRAMAGATPPPAPAAGR